MGSAYRVLAISRAIGGVLLLLFAISIAEASVERQSGWEAIKGYSTAGACLIASVALFVGEPSIARVRRSASFCVRVSRSIPLYIAQMALGVGLISAGVVLALSGFNQRLTGRGGYGFSGGFGTSSSSSAAVWDINEFVVGAGAAVIVAGILMVLVGWRKGSH